MTSYLVTGADGLLGRRVLARLLARGDDARVGALVPRSGLPALAAVTDTLPDGDRVVTVLADDDTGAPPADLADFGPLDHLVHLDVLDDPAADAATVQAVNADAAATLASFAAEHGAVFHLLSSVGVAGDHQGPFRETDFELGQNFANPCQRSFFDAELAVRQTPGLRWRSYRCSTIVGDSVTGEMDELCGPYYFLGQVSLLDRLPRKLPVPWPDLGELNLVPVDYVADALSALLEAEPEAQQRVYHLGDPQRRSLSEVTNAITPDHDARTFDALPRSLARPLLTLTGQGALRTGRDLVAQQLGVPPAVLDVLALPVHFDPAATAELLERRGVRLPRIEDYGPRLWRYWAEHLDPARNRRDDPRGPLVGKVVVITGGSTGIGRATARMCVARGAHVILVARDADKLTETVDELSAEVPKPGLPLGTVSCYPADVTDEDAVRTLVKSIIAEHDHIDILVNNAGRSIRRAATNSLDRSHDYHRTMAVNYFGAVYLTLAVLPHMIERQAGHVVNVSTATTQTRAPRFGAYASSYAALEAFTDVTAAETLSDHVTFTTVRLPLTRTKMIAPTAVYDSAHGIWGVDKAAARILHGMIDRPVRSGSRFGSLVEWGHRRVPRLTTRILHQTYLMLGESAAALHGRAEEPLKDPAVS
ncbi:SDR family oxidoreductase [Gordonia sp. VNK21]|uniref:SDR family oxidoreductase n=1 Tax=Gordonia sp. VNK21 TaxID=3382483 RepID=UPI0038D4B0A6